MVRLIRRLCIPMLFCLFTFAAFNPAVAQAPAKPADPAPAAPKDVLVFSNGDTLTGTFERSTGANVTFKSDMAGEITIGWDKIKELKAAGRYAVLESGFKTKSSRKLNDARIPQGTVTMTDQTVTVQGDAGPPTTVATKDTEFIIDNTSYEKELRGHPGLFSDWTGALTGGASLVYSTQNSEQFSGAINLVRLVPNVAWLDPRSRDTVNVLETYGKVTQPGVDTVKTSIFHADAEHDMYFTPRAYGLLNTSFDHNYSQGLSLQQIYGGGIGLTVVKDAKQEFDVKAQVQYEAQSFQAIPPADLPPNPNNNLIGGTFAENYLRKLKHVTFNEQIQLVPAFNSVQDFSVVGQAGLVFPVYKRLSFSVNTLDTYLGDPQAGAKRNSFQLITCITYTLK
jgi:hypothetical protein